MSDELTKWRADIDALDAELVKLLSKRDAVVAQVWAWKKTHEVAQVDAGREAAMRERLAQLARAEGLNVEAVERVFAAIIGRRFR